MQLSMSCRFYAAEVVTALEYLHCQGSHICHTNYINEILFAGGGRMDAMGSQTQPTFNKHIVWLDQ